MADESARCRVAVDGKHEPVAEPSGRMACLLCRGYLDTADKLREIVNTRAESARAPAASGDVLKEEAAHEITIGQRDAAQDAADTMASLILGEEINWAYHDAKWREAIEKLEDSAAMQPAQVDVGWQPIESAPVGKTLVLWADISMPDLPNWRMATGWLGYDGVWEWDGTRLDKEYHLKPTHWQPMPKRPTAWNLTPTPDAGEDE